MVVKIKIFKIVLSDEKALMRGNGRLYGVKSIK